MLERHFGGCPEKGAVTQVLASECGTPVKAARNDGMASP
jgi:hypothetical protein